MTKDNTKNPSVSDPLYGVMVDDTWVTGWTLQQDILIVDCIFSLWSGNPYYEEPKVGEWTCYKEGQLILHRPQISEGIFSMEEVEQTVDMDGSVDYGSLDSAVLENRALTLCGPFGTVKVVLDDFELHLSKSPPNKSLKSGTPQSGAP